MRGLLGRLCRYVKQVRLDTTVVLTFYMLHEHKGSFFISVLHLQLTATRKKNLDEIEDVRTRIEISKKI
jgi:hypothetical protein